MRHISRVNYAEFTGDRPRQPIRTKFSALNVDFNGVIFNPLRRHQIWVPPSKLGISATVD